MPLFAETSEVEKWIGPIITALLASVTALFAWLSARDKLRFDAKTAKLESDILYLKTGHERCEQERREECAEYARDRVKLEGELHELRELVMNRQDKHGTDKHRRPPRGPE